MKNVFSSKKNNLPIVSVIIPCYNYGKFVEEAIDSVLFSTYKNVEIIVIDDGPTDLFTINLLKNLNKQRTRVIFQKNQGLARSRNNGILQAKGEFILPLDADDKIDPTYIEKALNILMKNPKLGLAYGYVQVFGSQNFFWKTGEYSIKNLIRENIIPSCSLFRKQAWEEVGGYDNDRLQYDDWTFWLKLASKGFYGQLIPEVLFFHRKHRNQDNMTDRLHKKHEEYYNKIKNKFPEFFEKKCRLYNRFFSIFSLVLHYILPKSITRILYFVKIFLFRLIFDRKNNLNTDLIVCESFSEKKNKLLIFLPWVSRGGVEKVTLDLIKNFNDYDIFLVTTVKNDYDSVVDLEFKSLTKNVYHLPNFLNHNDYLFFIKKIILVNNINTILINHCAWAYENMEEIKKITPNVNFFDLLHNTAVEGYKNYSLKYNEFIRKTIVISEEIRCHLIHELKIPQKKVECILNGIDLDGVFNPLNVSTYKIKKEFNFPADKFIVSFIGRMSIEKNPLKFIEVAKEMKKENPKKYFFIMAGGGELIDDANKEIQNNFSNNEFVHLGNFHNPEKILALSGVLMNTSKIEGMPLTILESLAMEVPVIAPDVGGIREIIKDGENGYLLSRNPSIAEYIIAIENISNFEIHAKMKKNTRQSVVSFSSVEMSKRYKQLFEDKDI